MRASREMPMRSHCNRSFNPSIKFTRKSFSLHNFKQGIWVSFGHLCPWQVYTSFKHVLPWELLKRNRCWGLLRIPYLKEVWRKKILYLLRKAYVYNTISKKQISNIIWRKSEKGVLHSWLEQKLVTTTFRIWWHTWFDYGCSFSVDIFSVSSTLQIVLREQGLYTGKYLKEKCYSELPITLIRIFFNHSQFQTYY